MKTLALTLSLLLLGCVAAARSHADYDLTFAWGAGQSDYEDAVADFLLAATAYETAYDGMVTAGTNLQDTVTAVLQQYSPDPPPYDVEQTFEDWSYELDDHMAAMDFSYNYLVLLVGQACTERDYQNWAAATGYVEDAIAVVDSMTAATNTVRISAENYDAYIQAYGGN